MRLVWVNVLLGLLLVINSCQCQRQPKQKTVRLFLASSLLSIKQDLEKLFPKNNKLEINFASSSQIARQIENGAPCDAVILASKKWYTYLVNKKLAQNGADLWVTNSLILVTNSSKHENSSVQEILEKSEKILIADPQYVPLGEYTKQFLESIYLYGLFENKFIKAHSAANTLNLFEQKLADSAFLYKSDALRTKKASVNLNIPVNLHEPIIYPFFGCPKRKTSQFEKAREILFSPKAKQILERAGFIVAHW